MQPSDANPFGNVHGGVIPAPHRHRRRPGRRRHARSAVVTASIDRMDFLTPAFIGEVATFTPASTLVGNTSMEVGVRVECEKPRTAKPATPVRPT
jgi:acyl-CoA hydrolase